MEDLVDLGLFLAGLGIFFVGIGALDGVSDWDKSVTRSDPPVSAVASRR
jgi:hypothetical protein